MRKQFPNAGTKKEFMAQRRRECFGCAYIPGGVAIMERLQSELENLRVALHPR